MYIDPCHKILSTIKLEPDLRLLTSHLLENLCHCKLSSHCKGEREEGYNLLYLAIAMDTEDITRAAHVRCRILEISAHVGDRPTFPIGAGQ